MKWKLLISAESSLPDLTLWC